MNVDEYIQAVNQYQEEQRLNELLQQNIPEEYAREMLENRKFREQLESERQAKQREEQQNAEFNDFFKYFKEANGRDFVPETDGIPDSVWQANQQGVPLRYAYAEYENQQLRQQLNTLKKNQDNAKKAPVGGVTQHGSHETASEDPFLKGFNSI
jgi:regulator of replication initiation timing